MPLWMLMSVLIYLINDDCADKSMWLCSDIQHVT